jgi:hypothetical protein
MERNYAALRVAGTVIRYLSKFWDENIIEEEEDNYLILN